VLVDEVHVLML
jgi:hypothetical protein